MDKCTSVDSYDWLSVCERSRHVRCVRQLRSPNSGRNSTQRSGAAVLRHR